MAEKNESGKTPYSVPGPNNPEPEKPGFADILLRKAEKIKYLLLAALVILALALAIVTWQRRASAERDRQSRNQVFKTVMELQNKPGPEAKAALEKAAKDFAGTPAGSSASMYQFANAFNTHDYAEAEKSAKAFIGGYPSSPMVPRMKLALGQALAEQGKTSEAIAAFRNLVAANDPGTMAEAKLALAQSLERDAEAVKDNPEEYRRRLEAAEAEYNDIIVRSRITAPGQRGFWPQAVTMPADYALVQLKDRLAGNVLGTPTSLRADASGVTEADLRGAEGITPPGIGGHYHGDVWHPGEHVANEAVPAQVRGMVDGAVNTAGAAANAVGAAVGSAAGAVADKAGAAANAVGSAAGAAKDAAGSAVQGAAEVAREAKDAVAGAAGAVADKAGDAAQAAKDAVGSAAGAVADKAGAAANAVGSAAGAAKDAAGSAVQGAAEVAREAKDAVAGAAGAVADKAGAAANAVGSTVGAAAGAVKDALGSAVHGAAEVAREAKDAVAGAAGAVADKAGAAVEATKEAVGSAAGSAVDATKDAAGSAAGAAKHAVDAAVRGAGEVGRDVKAGVESLTATPSVPAAPPAGALGIHGMGVAGESTLVKAEEESGAVDGLNMVKPLSVSDFLKQIGSGEELVDESDADVITYDSDNRDAVGTVGARITHDEKGGGILGKIVDAVEGIENELGVHGSQGTVGGGGAGSVQPNNK